MSSHGLTSAAAASKSAAAAATTGLNFSSAAAAADPYLEIARIQSETENASSLSENDEFSLSLPMLLLFETLYKFPRSFGRRSLWWRPFNGLTPNDV